MTNYAQIWLILANCGRIYGQKWPDLWPNEILGMAMAIVAIPDITPMCKIDSKIIFTQNKMTVIKVTWVLIIVIKLLPNRVLRKHLQSCEIDWISTKSLIMGSIQVEIQFLLQFSSVKSLFEWWDFHKWSGFYDLLQIYIFAKFKTV